MSFIEPSASKGSSTDTCLISDLIEVEKRLLLPATKHRLSLRWLWNLHPLESQVENETEQIFPSSEGVAFDLGDVLIIRKGLILFPRRSSFA